jgi:hypothetical protein
MAIKASHKELKTFQENMEATIKISKEEMSAKIKACRERVEVQMDGH